MNSDQVILSVLAGLELLRTAFYQTLVLKGGGWGKKRYNWKRQVVPVGKMGALPKQSVSKGASPCRAYQPRVKGWAR